MSTIEGRNRQDIHKGKNDRDEGCHRPEAEPIPQWGEEATNGSKTTKRGGSLLCEDVFEINDEGFAQAKVDVVPENVKEECMDAAEGCPVSAIVVED